MPMPSPTPPRRYQAENSFVLRSTVVPLERWLDLLQQRDRETSAQQLWKLLDDPLIREALLVASPTFDEQLDKVRGRPDHPRRRQVELTALRYVTRAATRATPFGLFAGISVATIGPSARLEVPSGAFGQRQIRPDMLLLCTLAEQMVRDRTIRLALRFRPNETLHHYAGRWFYIEARTLDAGRTHALASVEDNPFVARLLSGEPTWRSIDQLVELLQQLDGELPREPLHEFVHSAIDEQLLVADLAPRVTASDSFAAFREQLRDIPAAADQHATIEAIDAAITTWRAAPPGGGTAAFPVVAAAIARLPIETQRDRLVQVDLWRSDLHPQLPPPVMAELARGIDLLWQLAPRPPDRFREFRESYRERYESRVMPLLEVLDEEQGIGFELSSGPGTETSALLEGLEFPGAVAAASDVAWGRRENLLLRLLHEAVADGAQEINLTEQQIERLRDPNPKRLPDALAALVRIAARDAAAIDAGEYRLMIELATGPSGATMLGRFGQNNPELTAAIREHHRHEEQLDPTAIYAEIVHLPEGRVGNVLLRPLLRRYEIPFLGTSGADEAHTIPLSDLLVQLEGETITLWSEARRQRVIPRLTSAHNVDAKGLTAYRFLAALRHQDCVPGVYFNWGPLAGSRFLPRVVHGPLVLSRASWRLDAQEIAAIAERRISRGLPRYVVLRDGDHELAVDLDNELSLEMLASLSAQRPVVDLIELFPPLHEQPLAGPDGHFAHELVVPFVAETAVGHPPDLAPARSQHRARPPGSEWLYLSLYGGPASIDRWLRNDVAPLVESMEREADSDCWFFVRYADPDWHLRLRFRGSSPALLASYQRWMVRHGQSLLDDRSCRRITLGTYEREVDRYGGEAGLAICESLFHADSAAAIDLLNASVPDASSTERWQCTALGALRLATALGLEGDALLSLFQRLQRNFSAEHGDGSFVTRLHEHERRLRAGLAQRLTADDLPPDWHRMLDRRDAAIAAGRAQLEDLARAGQLGVTIPTLAESLVHLHVNRMLRAAHRAQEAVLYFLLWRWLAGARGRNQK